MRKPGFLLIELMIAVVIGLVLIAALMRMQVLLLELQDSFFMRDRALAMAAQRLEYGGTKNSGILVQAGRDFRISFDKSEPDRSEPGKPGSKVKVVWQSLVGKNCSLKL